MGSLRLGKTFTDAQVKSVTDQLANQIKDLSAKVEEGGGGGSGDIPDGGVTTAKLANGAVTTIKLSDLAVETAKIGNAAVTSSKIADGAISLTKLPSNLRPVEIASVLPTTGNVPGRIVFNSSDNKIYRFDGNAFTASVAASDITGQLSSDQIGTISASKISGQIGNSQLADGAVAATNVLDDAIIAAKIADAAVTANKIQNDAVTSLKLADQAVTTTKLQVAAVTADVIANGAIIDTKLANAAVTAQKLAAGVVDATKFAAGIEPVSVVPGTTLPTTKTTNTIYLNNQIYRWDSSLNAYSAAVPTVNLTGQLSDSQIAAIDAAKIAGQLGDSQIAAINATKVTGKLTDGQIQSVAAAKLTGQITATQITDGAISTPKLAAGAVTANELAANAVVAGKIAANSITATQLAAGSVTTAKLTAGAVTANELSANSVTAGKISAGAVIAGNIAADTVTANEIAANSITTPKLAAGAVTTAKLTAGAVTANELAANSVVAGKIAAGAVSADQIAAGAITAGKIAAGAITTNTLAVGTGGNYLDNSDLSAGLTGWAYEWSNEFASFRMSLRTDTYAPLPGAIEIYQGNGNQGVEYGVGQVNPDGSVKYFAVKGGGYYELSCYYLGHRCTGIQPYLGTYDATDTLIGYTQWGIYQAAQNIDPKKNLANFQRFWGKTQVPTNAVKVRVFFRMKGTLSGNADSYLWINRMFFGEATAAQSEPTPWSDSGVTLISGGNITANAITTDKIAANAITAGKIAAGAVTAGTIAAGVVTAATIQGGSITGDKIAANTIGANQIAANAITAKQLVLTDFSNIADNGWQTGTLDGWLIQNQQNFYNDTGNTGDSSGWVLQSLGRDCARSNFITVTAGETYFFDVWVYNTDTNPASILAVTQTPAGAFSYPGVVSTDAKNSWTRLQGRFTVPSGINKLAMLLQVNKTANTGGSAYWSKPVMRRAASAELIVDGAITANKIAANSISADKIAANSIDASKLSVGNLSAISGTLGAVNISSAVIGSLTVGTGNIQGGAVTSVGVGRIADQQNIGSNGTVNLVACGVQVDGDSRVVVSAMTLGQFNKNGNSQNSQPIGCNVFRDGLAIFSQTYYLGVVQTVVSGSNGNGNTASATYTAGPVTVPALYDAPGPGWHTYTLQIYCPGNTIGWRESNIVANAFKR